MRVVLVGAGGRMGRAVAQTLAGAEDVTLKARVERPEVAAPVDGGAPWGHDLGAFVARGDVVVEFSSPAAAAAAAAVCAECGAALVSGTTGLGDSEEEGLRAAARKTAIVRAANFSLGVLALRRALATALGAVPASWDVEIVERHHRGKQDAPSGTALQLAREAAERRGYPASALRMGRSGRVGARPDAEIGIHALRGGTWVGDHAVVLAGAGEWLELRHVAEDRTAFAHGVLAAARFVATAPPGFYTLDEVASAAAR
ncbi:MAG: 4-hydroxy-tetrahydrodipicolinate reductase [Candidatus Eisenbacteria bacterium]